MTDATLLTLHEAAKLALSEQRYEDALHHLERAIGLAPSDLPAHTMSGIAHQRLGHVEQALKAFRQVLSLDANNPVAHFNLGQMLHLAGDDENARDHLERCLELDGSHLTAKDLLAKLCSDA